MSLTRRNALSLSAQPSCTRSTTRTGQSRSPLSDPDSEDTKLPNGKSQKDAISKQEHEEALKDVESLIHMAEELRDDLKHFGEYVVALSSVRKTEEIEKLARRIRGRLKA